MVKKPPLPPEAITYDSDNLDPERLAFLKAHIDPRVKTILDLGCGGGKYSVYFAKAGFAVAALDHNPSLLKAVGERARKAQVQVKTGRVDLEKVLRGQALLPEADAIFLFDVLEHVSDDVKLLARLKKAARYQVIVNVPTETPPDLLAVGFVLPHYSDLDHKRYYREDTLAQTFRKAGLKVGVLKPLNPMAPKNFMPYIFDQRHLLTRFVTFFLHGRGRSVKYRVVYNSLMAVGLTGKKAES